MATVMNRTPFQGSRERAEQDQRDNERRNIWHRCETLLREEEEERREAQRSAVLGYN